MTRTFDMVLSKPMTHPMIMALTRDMTHPSHLGLSMFWFILPLLALSEMLIAYHSFIALFINPGGIPPTIRHHGLPEARSVDRRRCIRWGDHQRREAWSCKGGELVGHRGI